MESARNHSHPFLIIPITFLVAFMLTLLPMPDWTIWLRPAWVLMVLIYWIMILPHRINLGMAFIMGILLDVLNGTLLGEHALAMTLATYVVARMHSRMRMFSLFQQALCVMLIVFLYQAVLYGVQGFLGQLPASRLFWASPHTSFLLWPWLSGVINSSGRRYRVVEGRPPYV